MNKSLDTHWHKAIDQGVRTAAQLSMRTNTSRFLHPKRLAGPAGIGLSSTGLGQTAVMIASNNADLWDGFLTNTVSLNEKASPLVENRVFTGSNSDGTSVGISGGNKPLGVLVGDAVRTGQSDSNQF